MPPEPSDSLSEFSSKLSESGILTDASLRALSAQFLQEHPDGDGDAFGGWLLERKSLTAYQRKCLKNGDGKNLVYGSYIVLDELGEGGMGKVYLARHSHMNRQVALKVLYGRHLEDKKSVRRFSREIETTANLHHSNIASAYDAGESNGALFYAMEFVDGPNLRQLVDTGGKLSPGDAIECTLQTAHGLAAAHQQGIVHRDVKPANLALSKDRRVKILDLGIAGFIPGVGGSGDMLTVTAGPGSATLMGTIDFMAPEQAESISKADHRSDIYSLGCTLFFLLTGKPLYQGNSLPGKVMAHRDEEIPNLSDVRPDISAKLNDIFRKMVAKEPKDRYPSMNDVIEALSGLETRAPRTQIAETAYRDTNYRPVEQAADPVPEPPGNRGELAGNKVLIGVAALGAIAALSAVAFAINQAGSDATGGQKYPLTPPIKGDGTVAVLQKVTAEAIWRHEERIKALGVTPDGLYVVSAGTGRGGNELGGSAIVVREIASGVEQKDFTNFTGLIRALAVAPDGSLIAASDSPPDANSGALATVSIYDRVTGELVRSSASYVGEIRALSFRADGNALLAGGSNGSVQQIDVHDASQDRNLLKFEGPVLSLQAMQPMQQSGGPADHAVIATWHSIALVDLASGDYLQSIEAHQGPILATLPWKRGTEIISGGDDHLIRRWSSANGNLIQQIDGHTARITGLAKVDERHFLSSSDDGTIRLWNSETGNERARFEGHIKQVTCIAVLPGGEYFVSGGDDRSLRLWRIPPPEG